MGKIMSICWKKKVKILVIFTSLIILAPSTKVSANPIPIPSIDMPEENIGIALTLIDGAVHVEVDGAYPFLNRGYSSIDMSFPVPPDSENILVRLGNEPLDWSYSGNEYPTVVENFSVIKWTVYPAPRYFVIETRYEHEVPVVDNLYTLVYAMGTGKYLESWAKETTVYVTIRVNFPYENLKAYAGAELLSYESTTEENDVTILTLTKTSEAPLTEDLIIVGALAPVETDLLPPRAMVAEFYPRVQVGYGEPVDFTLAIANKGAEDATYVVEVVEETHLGWDFSVEPEVELASGENTEVTITITVPYVENLIRTDWTVTVTDLVQPFIMSSETFLVIGDPTAQPPPEVNISLNQKTGGPGDTLEYTVEVTNMGGTEVTFDLTAVPDTDGWIVSIWPKSLTLAAGASGTATLSVTIPSAAEDGSSRTITVTAISQTDSTIRDNATCTATAKAAESVSPLVYVGAAVVIVVIITVVLIIKPF